MMYQLITIQKVTNQDYPIQYLSSPSTSIIEEMDIRDFLINILSNLIRQNIKRPSYNICQLKMHIVMRAR